MQGSKRSHCYCTGGKHSQNCLFGKRNAYDIRWQDIRKRLHNEFFFGDIIKFHYNPHNYTFFFYLDGQVLLEIPCLTDDYYPVVTKGKKYYYVHELLKLIEDHFNVEKKDLLDYHLDEKTDPLGIHVLLKCADKRIGVRRLREMYQDLFFEQLLGDGNVGCAIKVLQKRIKSKNIFINDKQDSGT